MKLLHNLCTTMKYFKKKNTSCYNIAIPIGLNSGAYGEKGFESLERHVSAKNSRVCIAFSEKIKTLADVSEYRRVSHQHCITREKIIAVKVLLSLASQKTRPQVVVCFCEGQAVRKFFTVQRDLAKQIKKFQRFQWIGSDGWADRNDVIDGLEDEAAGGFSIRIHAPKAYASFISNEKNLTFRFPVFENTTHRSIQTTTR